MGVDAGRSQIVWLASGAHAVQFEDEIGEIEFTAPLSGAKPPNMRINRDQLHAMFGPLIEHNEIGVRG